MDDLATISQADLEKLSNPKPFLEEIEAKLKVMLADAKSMLVNSAASAKVATEKAQGAKMLEQSLEKQRKIIVEPLKKHTTNIDRMFKIPRDGAQAVVKTYGDKVSHFAIEETRKANEIAEQEKKRLEKNYAAQAKRADEAGRDAPTPPAIPEAVTPKQIVAGAKQREVWDFETVDLSKVPVQFLEIKRGDVLRALGAGYLDIPGIKAFKKTVTSFAT